MAMPFVVVAYYTEGILYVEQAKRLLFSLEKYQVPHDVVGIASLGNWYANMQWKPTFIQRKLEEWPEHSVVYVDADAEFLDYPKLFDDLGLDPSIHVAAHLLDHRKRGRPRAEELLSGTIYFQNSLKVRSLVAQWISECKKDPRLWDQKALDRVLPRDSGFFNLPEEYCTIFDYMSDVKSPIIRHYQASRIAKSSGAFQRNPHYRSRL